jgi:hypothetical protein
MIDARILNLPAPGAVALYFFGETELPPKVHPAVPLLQAC